MNKPRVIVTQRTTHEGLLAELSRLDEHCDVRRASGAALTHDELKNWLQDAEGWITGGEKIDAQLLESAQKLRVICQPSVGYDNIDVAACTSRHIRIGNTPGVLTEATADLGYGLLLAAARKITEGWDYVRGGDFGRGEAFPFGVDLYDKILGIVGMGQIGVAIARRARASGMRIIYHNRKESAQAGELQARYVDMNELLTESDFVLLLTPLTPDTRKLIGAEQFTLMKKTAFLINMARGLVVDTDALVHALQTGKIAFAALDVTDPEPLPADHPLLKMDHVLISPHIGSATNETRTRMERLTVDNLLAGIFGRPMPQCVNPDA